MAHSHLREFNPEVKDLTSFAERSGLYFAANEVKEADIQRAVLFSADATYKLIKKFLTPAKPAEVELKDIVKPWTEHYQPKPQVQWCSITYSILMFTSRVGQLLHT